MPFTRLTWLTLFVVLLFAGPASAQEAGPVAPPPQSPPPFSPIPNFSRDATREGDGTLYKPSSTVAQQPGFDIVTQAPAGLGAKAPDDGEDDDPARRREFRWAEVMRFQYTLLPGFGSRGVGMNDFQYSTLFSVPTHADFAPVELTPGFAAHLWDGPAQSRGYSAGPAFPLDLYEFYCDIGWRPRLARWLFLDLGVTPSLNSDLKELSSQSFRPQARALTIVALSKEFQFVGGWLYVNRQTIHAIPAGGILWNPSTDVRLELVFPQPKASFRLSRVGEREWWCYLGGEFGGGAWTAEQPDGRVALINYNDVRVRLGIENVLAKDARGYSRNGWNVELGYTLHRNIDYLAIQPANTFMARAGFHF